MEENKSTLSFNHEKTASVNILIFKKKNLLAVMGLNSRLHAW
jgi:hypothetical protein